MLQKNHQKCTNAVIVGNRSELGFFLMDHQEILKQQLERLEHEHHDLDGMIDKMLQEALVDQVSVQRLKKRKLLLKDQISSLRSKVLPDIIA